MPHAYINRIATAVPPYDVHEWFVRFTQQLLEDDRRSSIAFRRIAHKAGITHRYSWLDPGGGERGSVKADEFYLRGHFPDTAARMRLFERYSPVLAAAAVERLGLGHERTGITHLIITCCTGYFAPGLDLEVIERCNLPRSVECTIVGFMGCQAAINALRLAQHIVRSEATARVLVVNLELCTLHLQDTKDLEQILAFLQFADGCAASLVTARPIGIALEGFRAMRMPGTGELITWRVRDFGFDMWLSGGVPAAIQAGLEGLGSEILGGAPADSIRLWAVHPGGRSVLDAVEHALSLAPPALSASREVLRRYGNMSSPTVMFVLKELLDSSLQPASGCAMSFGPGMVAETMRFRVEPGRTPNVARSIPYVELEAEAS